MAPVIGYVAAVSEKDVKDDPLLEVPGFKIGKSGIEKYLEQRLRGKGGILKLEVNAYGRVMKEIEETEGVHGENITLTLDARLQEKPMTRLAKRVARQFCWMCTAAKFWLLFPRRLLIPMLLRRG